MEFNKDLMIKRKILSPDDDVESFLSGVVSRLAKDDEKRDVFEPELREHVLGQKIVLGTPIMMNIFDEKKPLNACTVIPVDLRADMKNIKDKITPYLMAGMGTGFNLSDLDAPILFLEKLNDMFLEIDKETQRPVAGIIVLDANHKDILKFIDFKRDADFSRWRFNLSVLINDEFMSKLFGGCGHVTDSGVSVLEVYKRIVDNMHYCGEPGILFIDRFNETNPVKRYEYKGFAPCAEIAMAEGEACLFSHLNLAKFYDEKKKSIDYDALAKATHLVVRMLDNACQISIKHSSYEQHRMLINKRRIGVGVCGLADLLVRMEIPYDSDEALLVAKNVMSCINYQSKVASINLSDERGVFPLFLNSEYYKKKSLFMRSSSLSTWRQWHELWKRMQKVGIRNSSTVALPPTGNSSRIVRASNSIESMFSLKGDDGNILPYVDELLKGEKSYAFLRSIIEEEGNLRGAYQCGCVSKKAYMVLKTAQEIHPIHHIRMVSSIQPFVDDAISKTINLGNKATFGEISTYIKRAYYRKLKGITCFRDNCLMERKAGQNVHS